MLLHYQEYSTTGKPLIVLHGLFGNQANWGWHCKQLASHYRVFGFDLRNHGRSSHAEEMTYPLMVEDVIETMQHLGLEEALFIGHSMGGKVAMQLALSYPEKVEKLIVVDIAPVTYGDISAGHLKLLAAMQAMDLGQLQKRNEAEEQLREFEEDEATRKFVLTNLVRLKKGGYKWRLNVKGIEENYDNLREGLEGEGSFSGPTLFVKGALSNYIHARYEQQILKLFPQANVKIIMEAGHWVHAERPQVFQKIAQDFLGTD